MTLSFPAVSSVHRNAPSFPTNLPHGVLEASFISPPQAPTIDLEGQSSHRRPTMRAAFTAWMKRNHGWKYRTISPNEVMRPITATVLHHSAWAHSPRPAATSRAAAARARTRARDRWLPNSQEWEGSKGAFSPLGRGVAQIATWTPP